MLRLAWYTLDGVLHSLGDLLLHSTWKLRRCTVADIDVKREWVMFCSNGVEPMGKPFLSVQLVDHWLVITLGGQSAARDALCTHKHPPSNWLVRDDVKQNRMRQDDTQNSTQ